MGGDINEPRLLEVPITAYNLTSTSVVIVCDLSKPQNCLSSLLKWLKRVREVVDKRIRDLQSTDSNAALSLRETAMAAYRNNESDSSRVRPFEVSLYIVANKYDKFREQPQADRRCLMQILRFVSHYYGATLITTSIVDATLKDSFRGSMTGICFRIAAKAVCEVVLEKPVTVSAGRDDFESILLAIPRTVIVPTNEGDAHAAAAVARLIVSGKDNDGKKKHNEHDGKYASKLVNSNDDIGLYVTASGPTRDCWERLADHVKSMYGAVESSSAEEKGGHDHELDSGHGDEKNHGRDGDDDFPEPDIDDMRAQRDAALERYIQEAERREQTNLKMNSAYTSRSGGGDGGGISGGGAESKHDRHGGGGGDEDGGGEEKKSNSKRKAVPSMKTAAA